MSTLSVVSAIAPVIYSSTTIYAAGTHRISAGRLIAGYRSRTFHSFTDDDIFDSSLRQFRYQSVYNSDHSIGMISKDDDAHLFIGAEDR